MELPQRHLDRVSKHISSNTHEDLDQKLHAINAVLTLKNKFRIYRDVYNEKSCKKSRTL